MFEEVDFVDQNTPVIMGLLKKRGLGWFYKPWRSRNFSLISTDHFLYLKYEDPETNKLKGNLSICNTLAEVIGITDQAYHNTSNRNLFKLQVYKCSFSEFNEVQALSGIKELIVSASNSQERDDWIRILNECIIKFYADLPIPQASFHSFSKHKLTKQKEFLSLGEEKFLKDWANLYRFYEVVKTIENRDCDLDVENGNLGTPLSFALRGKNAKNDVDIVRLLLKCGADPNVPDKNCPILRALLFAKLEIVDLLIKYGANINQRSYNQADQDWTGDTLLLVFLKSLVKIPQTMAGRKMIRAAIQLAIEKGADVNIRDKQGKSGKDYMAQLRIDNNGV